MVAVLSAGLKFLGGLVGGAADRLAPEIFGGGAWNWGPHLPPSFHIR